VHEFAHSISNDVNHGFRRTLERIFGRILPGDLLSLMVWYLSTPAHQTMPRFWQEGLATWAETEYADPAGVWAGRGRDPLTHMIWRLDAAARRTPPVSDWRLTYDHWPYGREVYTYGVAYTRFLSAEFHERADVWDFVRAQGKSWPFVFDRGAQGVAGAGHGNLIERARVELIREQDAQLEILRGAPISELARLTPAGVFVAAPAWRNDGALEYMSEPASMKER
jgi:hypothetical protein